MILTWNKTGIWDPPGSDIILDMLKKYPESPYLG